jgi:selenocysteine lyase/cysteine desulfurase
MQVMQTSSEAALWQRHRDHFPITAHAVYLNHAGVAPLCRPAAEAMKHLADDALLYGSIHYNEWLDAYEGLRVAAARLVQADPSEIAIVKNTSEGIATVALGIDWRPGDTIVCFKEEFPANYFPWQRLEAKGVSIRWLPAEASLDQIDEACRGSRLLAISFVQYLTGFRVNLTKLGEICRRRGTFFFVDAIQGLGAFDLDVRRDNIDALSADGHKWLLGPEGCGVLYVRKEWQDSIEPVEFGWTNIAGYNDYSCRDMTLRPDAGRYECGTLNTIGCYGLRAALELILEIGVPAIGAAVQSLADRVSLGVASRGYEQLRKRTPETGAGIVSFRKPDQDSRLVVRQLRERGFIAAPRQGWVRVSPHFYQSPDDMDALVEALP